MSVRRVGSKRRPGRPLLGAEPLDARLTVMITTRMQSALETRSGGHVAEFVRRALHKALSGGGPKKRTGRKAGRKARRVRRYDK